MKNFSNQFNLLTIFVLLQSITLVAQDPPANPFSDYSDRIAKFLPPTPNSVAFTKYGSTPVNLSKGTPNITIPIHEINVDGVRIPITLTYDASGILVNELPTAVGLKWRLNAGGGIFRTVNNLPDEGRWLTEAWTSRDAAWYTAHPIAYNYPSTQDDYLKSQPFDHAPDDFTYNIAGQFGTFTFERKDYETINKETNDNFLISATVENNSITDFTGKDVSGNVYDFSIIEKMWKRVVNGSSMEDFGGNTTGYTTGWLINKIDTPHNRDIKFFYTDYYMDEYEFLQVSEKITQYGETDIGNCQGAIYGSFCGLRDPDGQHTHQSAQYIFDNIKTSVMYEPRNELIEHIITPTESINFFYEPYELGVAIWNKKLTKIEVLDLIDGNKKTIHFEYDSYPGDPRLRLIEVYEVGTDGSEKPPYEFTYFQGNLPSKVTKSKDYHNYYNGANNSLLIPLNEYSYYNLPKFFREDLADRNPNLDYARIGTLEEIKYPTGGKTVFEYELNQGENTIQDFKYDKKSFDFEVTSSTIPTTTNSNYKIYHTPDFTISANSLYGKSFTFPNGVDCNFLLNSTINDPDYVENVWPDVTHYKIYENLSTPVLVYEHIVGGPDNPDFTSINLPAGEYFIALYVWMDDFNDFSPVVELHAKWMEKMEDTNGNFTYEPFYVGGLRVKTITDFNEKGEEYNKVQYEYADLTGTNLICPGDINASMTSNKLTEILDNGEFVFSSDIIGKHSIDPITANYIGFRRRDLKNGHYYKNVTTKKVIDSDYLKTTNVYTQDFRNFRYQGKIAKKFMYNESDKIVNKTFYEYSQDSISHYYNLLGKLEFCYITNCNDGQAPGTIACPLYLTGYSNPVETHYSEYKSNLTKQINTEYFYSGITLTGSLTKMDSFTYNDDELLTEKVSNFRLKEISNLDYYSASNYTTDSNLEEYTVAYEYPKDYSATNNSMLNLKNANILDVPVSIQSSNLTDDLDGRFFEYDIKGSITKRFDFNKGKGTHIPSENYVPQEYELHSTYDNVGGRIKESTLDDGTIKSYIWDSTQTFLLAEVVNMSYSYVIAQTGTSILDLAISSDQDLIDAFDDLREDYSNIMVTSYIHSPLQGVKRVTQPNGDVLKYEYDSFNRLEFIRNESNEILKEFEYNYQH